MKILVLSDSHRDIRNMKKAVQIEKPDRILHLGDHYQDAMKLAAEFPKIPLDAVSGNCDYDRVRTEKLLLLEEHRIFLCHGHDYHVKSSYLSLQYAAQEKDADIVLFGHTHMIFTAHHNHMHIMNPGSIGDPRTAAGPSYGLLFLEDGQVFLQTQFLNSMI